ncbi:MAG: YeeE/YedE thiosulfate transporter family protein [Chloroflexota bacterium]
MSVLTAKPQETDIPRRENWLVAQIRKPQWSPYAAGAMLGLTVALSLLVAGQMPGSSGAFENLIAYVGQKAVPQNIYFKFVMPPGITWQVWLLLGLFLGALASAWLSHDFKWRHVPEKQWVAIFGPQRWKRWTVAFVGGIILEIGAGIAGGCTSGLAISGGVQLAPAAFLFIPGMFISGILTALVIYRKKY